MEHYTTISAEIHQHDWHNGRCSTCGLPQKNDEPVKPPVNVKSSLDLVVKQQNELKGLLEETKRIASDKGHGLIILILLILLVKSC